MYLNLLIFSVIVTLSQGIGTWTEENVKSSDLLVRNKRVIDTLPHGSQVVPITTVRYIVNIHKNGRSNCVGTILWAHIILTAAHCLSDRRARYEVLSGSSHIAGGTPHTIVHEIPHPDYQPFYFANDLAILIIYPPIDLKDSPNRRIGFYNRHVSPNVYGTVSGWGSIHTEAEGTRVPEELRSISVPIISQEQCENEYEHQAIITIKDICTLDPHKRCGDGDSGAPLVVGDKLAGIYSWTGAYGYGGPRFPDVYMNVSHSVFRNWIIYVMRQNQRPPQLENHLHNPHIQHIRG